MKSLSIFGKEARGLSHIQSCLKYQDSKKIINNKMASHHTHNQNKRHTQSFAVTGEKSQSSDAVWLQLFVFKTTTTGLVLHLVGFQVRGEDQA